MVQQWIVWKPIYIEFVHVIATWWSCFHTWNIFFTCLAYHLNLFGPLPVSVLNKFVTELWKEFIILNSLKLVGTDAFNRRPLCCPTFTHGFLYSQVLKYFVDIFLSRRELIFVKEKTVFVLAYCELFGCGEKIRPFHQSCSYFECTDFASWTIVEISVHSRSKHC